MPQNWWELFPEIQPSPFVRRPRLPGPGGMLPGPAIVRPTAAPYAAIGPAQVPPGAFDPSYFSGGELGDDALAGPYSGDIASSGYGPPPFAGDNFGPALDQGAALQHAAAAIQRGAAPDAVHARLHEMGHGDADSPSPFSDLIPDARQMSGTTKRSGVPMLAKAQLMPRDQNGLEGSVYPAAYVPDRLSDLQRRADPRMAPQKVGDAQKIFQPKAGAPLQDRAGGIGRAIVGIVNQMRRPNNPPALNLTPWQRRRRRENEVLAANPIIRSFLDMISFSEGNTNYDTLFGNDHRTFTDRSTHPGNRGQDYHGTPGGAAGRYQIMPRTYRDLNRLLGPYTMSDRDQDLMAIELIREGRALEPLLSGHLDEAVSRLGQLQTWTSFPVLGNGTWQRNPSHQPTRNIEDLRARFHDALNRASRPGPGIRGLGNSVARN